MKKILAFLMVAVMMMVSASAFAEAAYTYTEYTYDESLFAEIGGEWLALDGLGLMFLEEGPAARRMTPLVFVPGADTVFWESSCASGSSAVGMCLASREGTPVDLSLAEPGGKLHVKSDPLRAETWLFGSVRLLEECR